LGEHFSLVAGCLDDIFGFWGLSSWTSDIPNVAAGSNISNESEEFKG